MSLFRSPTYALFFTAFALLTLVFGAYVVWIITLGHWWGIVFLIPAAVTVYYARDVVKTYRRYGP